MAAPRGVPGKLSGPICRGSFKPRQRLRAIFVPGYQRDGKQQFILHQVNQIEAAAERQDIGIVSIRIPGLGLIFAGRKKKRALGTQRQGHRAQAALADASHRGAGLEMKPDLGTPTADRSALCPGLPPNRAAGLGCVGLRDCARQFQRLVGGKARPLAQRRLPAERAALLCQTLHIQPSGIRCRRLFHRRPV